MTANPYFSSFTNLPQNQLARAEAVNAIFNAIITGFNLLPDNNALAQDRVSFAGNDTGAANVYVITPTIPAASYVQGAQFSFIAANANTGASTLNVSGVGAVALTRQDLTNLVAGDITAGMIVQVRYDGTRFQLTSLPGSSVALASASAANAAASATAAATSATAAAGSATTASASAASITGVLTLSGSGNPNGVTRAEITNSNAGASAQAMFSAYNGTTICNVGVNGSSFTPSGILTANMAFLVSSNTLAVYTSLASPLLFGTNGAERMRVDASGNLGIGMSPVNILDITQNQNAASSVQILNNNGGAAAVANFVASNGAGVAKFGTLGTAFPTNGILQANNTFITSNSAVVIASGDAIKFAVNGSTAEIARFDTSGNLNVGSTTNYNAAKISTPGKIAATGSFGSTCYNAHGSIAPATYTNFFSIPVSVANQVSTSLKLKVTVSNNDANSGYAYEYSEWVVQHSAYGGAYLTPIVTRTVQEQQSVNSGVVGIAASVHASIASNVLTITIAANSSGATGFTAAVIDAQCEMLGPLSSNTITAL